MALNASLPVNFARPVFEWIKIFSELKRDFNGAACIGVNDSGNFYWETDPPEVNEVLIVGDTPPLVDSLLVASYGTESANVDSISYEWYRDYVQIDGADENNYTCVLDDVGSEITVFVTLSNRFGSTVVVSDPTAAVQES
jgi:hypothetical protein